ncbi:unnamed protein product [Amoebophrya sp. A120]|nr:unnamed protein product [Amoebophrya sp. A120]|eukprot:GSA120T00004647001.1
MQPASGRPRTTTPRPLLVRLPRPANATPHPAQAPRGLPGRRRSQRNGHGAHNRAGAVSGLCILLHRAAPPRAHAVSHCGGLPVLYVRQPQRRPWRRRPAGRDLRPPLLVLLVRWPSALSCVPPSSVCVARACLPASAGPARRGSAPALAPAVVGCCEWPQWSGIVLRAHGRSK